LKYYDFIGRDLEEVLKQLEGENKKIEIAETKPIFKYEGKTFKVVRIKEKGESIEITVVRI
jgi:hypothetical protein